MVVHTGGGSGRRDERTVAGIVQRSSVMQRTRDRARTQRMVNGVRSDAVRSDAGVAACKISCGIANGNRAIAAESRSPCRSGYRGPATEVPSAAAHAAKVGPTAAEAPGARATEMTAAAVPATAEVGAAVASAAATTPASAASSGSIDRARKRDRKNNHGQDFEFRHDNLLKPPPWSPP
jgi:hypothetical protein